MLSYTGKKLGLSLGEVIREVQGVEAEPGLGGDDASAQSALAASTAADENEIGVPVRLAIRRPGLLAAIAPGLI
jgi:hypothetical protein